MQSLDVGRPGPAGSHFGVDADNEADIKVKHPAASWRVSSGALSGLLEAVVLL